MRNLSQIAIVVAVMLISIFSIKQRWHDSLAIPVTPPHGENFNISCIVCHSSKGWKIDKEIYSFNHDSTEMPLIGQHTQVDCRLCHPTLIFSEAKSSCIECHNDMHESTVGKECSRCHTPHSWLVNNITQIHQQSRFPLVGVHARVDCFNCHLSESFQRYDVIGTECYTCHSDNYAATTAPNHTSAGYSTNCEDCHNVFSYGWAGAGFNHEFFPLKDKHLQDCKQCHITDAKLSPECVSCHQDNYNATTTPVHTCAGFSTDCSTCHQNAISWQPANWQHTKFELTQGHSGRECTDCHKDCNYPGTSSECVSCHQTDYNNTSNPAHSALNIPTSCVDCHNTTGWQPAKFPQHDALFPISSGKHKLSCDECHKTSNYKEFDCITCHNNKAELDDTHKDENGYAYTSAKCYECHPNGRADK